MRRGSTEAEEHLWQALRRHGVLGLKFRRQHAIGPFIVDFYCVKASLVIEVDGPIHATRRSADEERQTYLESSGLRVLRFSNDDVLESLPSVLEQIEAVIHGEAVLET